MKWCWALGAAWGMSLSLSAALARAECTKDIECKGDRVCKEGVCADLVPTAVTPGAPEAGGATEPARRHAEPPARTAPSAAPLRPAEEAVPPKQEPLGASGYHRRSNGMMITGIVLTSASGVALLSGIALGVTFANCNADLDEKYPDHVVSAQGLREVERCHSYANASTWALIAFLPLAGVGIPLWVVGARKVPNDQPTAVIVPWLTPHAGGLVLQGRL